MHSTTSSEYKNLADFHDTGVSSRSSARMVVPVAAVLLLALVKLAALGLPTSPKDDSLLQNQHIIKKKETLESQDSLSAQMRGV